MFRYAARGPQGRRTEVRTRLAGEVNTELLDFFAPVEEEESPWADPQVLEDSIDEAWAWQHGDPYYHPWDYEAEDRAYEAEEAAFQEVFTVIHLARAIVRTQLTNLS
jgi:hypothetical protein